MNEDAVVGVDDEPDDLPEGDLAGRRYDEQLKELLEAETDPKEIFLAALGARRRARARPASRRCTRRTPQDGFVSWEVDPTLAYDREATFDEAMRLHEWIDEPNLYVKIPATKPGLGAIEDCDRARQEHQRHADLLARSATARSSRRTCAGSSGSSRRGGDPSKVHSVASFFVSRVDTEADKRLEAIGTKARSRCAASSRSRTRSSRTSTIQQAFGGGRAGSSSPARARRRSAASGRPPRRRTRTTAT